MIPAIIAAEHRPEEIIDVKTNEMPVQGRLPHRALVPEVAA